MTSSARCSTRRALAAALAAVLAACGHAAGPRGPAIGSALPGERPRVVLMPIENLAGSTVATKELYAAVAKALGDRVEILSGDPLEKFLARHRLRYSGGLDAEAARAAREELGADAVLITSLGLYREAGPPALGLTMRLVSTEDEPAILWIDSAVRSGDQAPGLLGLGLVTRFEPLRKRVLGELARGLAAFLAGKRSGSRCDGGLFYEPKVRYRSPLLDDGARRTLAVVPFLNLTGREGAGDAVALEFVRQLVATGRFRVLEPGVVRDYLLRARVIMPGGISLETTRLFLGALGAEVVLSGVVLDFAETGSRAEPIVRFSATLLEGGSGDVIWSSSSFNRGNDGVFLFGLGRIANSHDLTCRMVVNVVDRLGRPGATVAMPEPDAQGIVRERTVGGREARVRATSGSGSGSTR
jgi:TolB-like protein